jgi:hypothetical protein
MKLDDFEIAILNYIASCGWSNWYKIHQRFSHSETYFEKLPFLMKSINNLIENKLITEESVEDKIPRYYLTEIGKKLLSK